VIIDVEIEIKITNINSLNDFNIVQFNCRSIYANLSELKIFLYTKKPHICCLSETWSVANRLPKFIDYKALWKHRDGRGGGLCILVRTNIIILPSALDPFPDPKIEIQRCKIKFRTFELDILNVYNPNNNISYSEFEHYLNQIGNHKMMLGDFNGHHAIWNQPNIGNNATGNSLKNVLDNFDDINLLTPFSLPTYVSPVSGRTSTLDLCFLSSNLMTGATAELGPCLGSDHYPVIIKLQQNVQSRVLGKRPKWILDKVDWGLWKNGLPEIELNGNESIEEINNSLGQYLKQSEYNIKQSSNKYNPKFNSPWWNAECSRLVAIRRRAKNIFRRHPTEENLRRLRDAENAVKREVKRSKEISWQEFVSTLNCFTPAKTIWDTLKKIRGLNIESNSILEENGESLVSVEQRMEAFLNYFGNIFNIPSPSVISENQMYFEIQGAIIDETEQSYNILFTLNEINSAIVHLKNSCPGVDDVHNLFLKNMPEKYIECYLKMFNVSWIEEKVPESWKVGLMIPILKPGKSSTSTSSYRPITMLSTVGKLMERMVCNRLEFVIESRNLISETQYGFRKGRSTYDSLTYLEHTIRKSLMTGNTCVVVFVDLKGAFDRVWHMGVIYKLKKLGFKGRILGWLYSYLQDRKFKILLEGKISNERTVTSGVPQGAVISPTLFNVLLSDIPRIEGVTYSEFADDLAIYCSGGDVEAVVLSVQRALDSIYQWTLEWGQSISIPKTKAMYFTNRRTYPSNITIDGQNLEYVSKFKFLGVVFDSPRLTWKDHINHLRVSCSSSISVMKSVSHNKWGADRKTLLKYYTATIRSKLDYASHLYAGAAGTHLDTLDVIQNQCLRIALGVKNTTPILSLTAEANIPPLKIRRRFLAIKYYLRVSEYPHNNPITQLYNYNCVTNNANKPFFQRAKDDLRKLGLNNNDHLPCPAVSPVPPWRDISCHFVETFADNVPKFLSDLSVQRLFKAMLDEDYKDLIAVYTDGSKTDDTVSAAVVFPDRQLTYNYKLPPVNCILFAELFAISKAIEYTKTNNITKFVIFTDSLSSIMLLAGRKHNSFRHLVHYIRRELLRVSDESGKAVIQWVPAHRGIHGNELADKAAKEAGGSDSIYEVRTPYEDMIKVISNKCVDYWQQDWESMILASGRGNDLRNIKDTIAYWPWTTNKSRAIETALARLRVGHVGLGQYNFKFRLTETPLCSCGEIETISHFLLECENYRIIRTQMMNQIRNLNINLPLNTKLLLGGSRCGKTDQMIIMKCVGDYLVRTGRLSEL